MLRRTGNVVSIAGGKPSGTFHGAAAFLDRYCGVRFYMPTDLFTSLPAGGKVVIGRVDMVMVPFVRSCYMSGIDHDNTADSQWVRRVGGWRRLGGTHQHNMYHVFPADKYAARLPEIYPILGGKRYIPASQADQGWQPCFSEPKLVDVGLETALAYFKRHPERQYLSFGVQDSHSFCQCPRCRRLIDTEAAKDRKLGRTVAYSHMYWRFVNKLAARVAERLPDRYLTALAYSEVRLPPPFKLHPNIIVFTNYHLSELPSDVFMKPGADGVTPLDRWLTLASRYGNHEWYQGGGYYMPRLYSASWRRFLRHLKSRIEWAYMHTECYPNWGFDGPKLYILARMWWDPDEDPDRLLGQFCDDMFGPAAAPMRRYWQNLETLWNELDNVAGPERKLSRWATQFITRESDRRLIRRCRGLLDQAAGLAATAEQTKRIALFSKCFRMSEHLFELAAAKDISKPQLDAALKHARQQIGPDPMAVHWPVPEKVAKAVKAVHWESIRGGYRPLRVPLMNTPHLSAARHGTWDRAAPTGSFILKGGGEDPKATAARIGYDLWGLHVRVVCPRKDMGRLVETADQSWRSDNVELFLDTDVDGKSFERHLCVKTTGRVVDWPLPGHKDAKLIRASVRKDARRYVVGMSLPWQYLEVEPARGKRINLQLIRNEFTKGPHQNKLTYQALISVQLVLD